MKEIKFRAWYSNIKKMSNWEYIKSLPYNWLSDYNVDKGIILMQYTGIKDKNDIEIYEGDIITYIYSYSEFDIDVNDIEPKEQKIINTIFDISMFQGCEIHFEIEVIGNIYKNPEMVK